LAALTGSRPELPERTVATGGAATRTAEAVAPDRRESTTRTAPARPDDVDSSTGGARSGRGRRVAITTGLVVAAAAIAAAVLALGEGGSGDPGTTSANAPAAGEASAERAAAAPQALTRSELIAKGDAICADSQRAFEEVRAEFPEAKSEEAPDVPYSEALVDISAPAVKRFEALDPPAGSSEVYGEYVQAQRRVHAYDVQALRAARAGHEGEYLAARERRDNGQGRRYDLARQVGFETCSANPG
jgi:hypothetical protein